MSKIGSDITWANPAVSRRRTVLQGSSHRTDPEIETSNNLQAMKNLLLTVAVASLALVTGNDVGAAAANDTSAAIRPFHPPKVTDAELADLRKRVGATRWSEKEYVADRTQG